MPPVPPRPLPYLNTHPLALIEKGRERVRQFCEANDLVVPAVVVADRTHWLVNACAYYRPDTPKNRKWGGVGVNLCVELCARCATEGWYRNWNWPGCVTDREPYGVICHELGHHVDWHLGSQQGVYWSDYGKWVMEHSGERPITSYAPNHAEWFAEICRLFVTNPALLRLIRPRAYELMRQKLEPIGHADWRYELGCNAPDRIVRAQANKFDRGAVRVQHAIDRLLE